MARDLGMACMGGQDEKTLENQNYDSVDFLNFHTENINKDVL